MNNILKDIEKMKSNLEYLYEKYKKNEEAIKKIREKIKELSGEALPGFIELKYVLNKKGKKYYYYYYRYYDRGKLKSVYLGKTIPEELLNKIKKSKELKVLQKTLKALIEENNKIIDLIRHIRRKLDYFST